ncbi:hypothetical protein ON010_g4616 [Phytophthora cinnamomi]|nr:hypothetical protein ON010_g4616 [Phytophthora cinnamomi]
MSEHYSRCMGCGLELALHLLGRLAVRLWDELERQRVEDGEQHHERHVAVVVEGIGDVRVGDTDDEVAQPVDADADGRGGGAHRVREQVGRDDPHERAKRGAEGDHVQRHEHDRQRRHVHEEGHGHEHGHDEHASDAPEDEVPVAEALGQEARGEGRPNVDEVDDERADTRVRDAGVLEDGVGVVEDGVDARELLRAREQNGAGQRQAVLGREERLLLRRVVDERLLRVGLAGRLEPR